MKLRLPFIPESYFKVEQVADVHSSEIEFGVESVKRSSGKILDGPYVPSFYVKGKARGRSYKAFAILMQVDPTYVNLRGSQYVSFRRIREVYLVYKQDEPPLLSFWGGERTWSPEDTLENFAHVFKSKMVKTIRTIAEWH